MCKPLQSPRQSHSQKRPENPSGATASFVGRIYRSPRREQQLDHGCMSILSRRMQRHLASGARDSTRTAEIEDVSPGGWANIFGYVRDRRSASRYSGCSWCEAIGEKPRAIIANQSCYMCCLIEILEAVAHGCTLLSQHHVSHV